MNVHFIFNISSSYFKNLLSFTLDKQMCESHDENRINIDSDFSIDENKEDQWDFQETKTNHEKDKKEETKSNDERNDDDKSSLLNFTKKRSLSFVKKKSDVKRCVKRRRFSSFFSSNENIATRNESNINSYTSFRSHRFSKSRLISSDSIDFEKDTCDDDKMKIVNERSRMIVIYEQQSWVNVFESFFEIEERESRASQNNNVNTYIDTSEEEHKLLNIVFETLQKLRVEQKIIIENVKISNI